MFFLRRAFQAHDFNGFLINPLEVFRLESVKTTGANVSSYNLFHRVPSRIVQLLKRT